MEMSDSDTIIINLLGVFCSISHPKFVFRARDYLSIEFLSLSLFLCFAVGILKVCSKRNCNMYKPHILHVSSIFIQFSSSVYSSEFQVWCLPFSKKINCKENLFEMFNYIFLGQLSSFDQEKWKNRTFQTEMKIS